uniref:Uncharacterized protein n=1 Tax=Timema shepardi TaxID=629360 RepID=A0A7R9G5C7_TIMSH|nr:unnamed protein product [Timema shepardi]
MCCNMLDTSALSFILPSAECDLGLSSSNKGILNAITYAGATICVQTGLNLTHHILESPCQEVQTGLNLTHHIFGESLSGYPDRIEPNPPYFGESLSGHPDGIEPNAPYFRESFPVPIPGGPEVNDRLSDRDETRGEIVDSPQQIHLTLGFGPFAVLATYVAEVHAAPYRASAVMFLGIAFGAMNLLIPGK